MSKKIKGTISRELDKLKRGLENLVKPKKTPVPQLVLQPIRNRKNF